MHTPVSSMVGSIKVESPPSEDIGGSRSSPASLGIMFSSTDRDDFGTSTDKEDNFDKGMLCIQEELTQLSVEIQHSKSPLGVLSSSVENKCSPRSLSCHSLTGSGKDQIQSSGKDSCIEFRDRSSRSAGWFDGLLGCLKPVWNILGKSGNSDNKDEWEIPFENIRDLQWLGSGAQGAVFVGRLNNDMVAVKKVREKSETDIKHLRKLNHPNVVLIKGVCTQAPCYCIVMEYCPYGQLYDMLKSGQEISPPTVVDWGKQIASGMNYLHSYRIIHRDLKSPNVLISLNGILKISDFGTCRQWNEISTRMSFAGTVAWMAPEIIRNEPCSEKVDIWSFGVVIWELLTCETPYRDVDSSAVIWGVGNNSLRLPIPTTCPEGFMLLMKQCWSAKPRNRPSFRHILMHLDIAAVEILSTPKEKYFKTQASWKEEIKQYMNEIKQDGNHISHVEKDLVQRRRDELRHAQDIREHYERKLDRANNLYMELAACLLQLEQREKELLKQEQVIQQCSGIKPHKKRIVRPLLKAHERLNKKRSYKLQSEQTSPENPQKLNAVTSNVASSSGHCSVKARIRRARHRRNGSHGGSGTYHFGGSGSYNSSPKTSPRKEQEGMVDNEVQTDWRACLNENDLISPSVTKPFDIQPANDGVNESEIYSDESNCNSICKICRCSSSDMKCCSCKNSFPESNKITSEEQEGSLETSDLQKYPEKCPRSLENSDNDHMNKREVINYENKPRTNNKLNANGVLQLFPSVQEGLSPKTSRRFKRMISDSDESPTAISVPVLATSGHTWSLGPQKTLQIHDESSSEEEGEVDDSDDCVLKSQGLVRIHKRSSRQSVSTLSSEGNLSEEENTSEYSSSHCTTNDLLSSLSNPDIPHHLDEEKDGHPSENSGISQRHSICGINSPSITFRRKIQLPKLQRGSLPPITDVYSSPALSRGPSSASETESVSDITVATTYPNSRGNTETSVW
ncbi:uncharacterized protein LOC143247252 [Tachypleus tridentatus]|uniref:uncharacterized protein LOC143247252 n=1 Tax=Tachypleus tridentatus TaxID=6853 RepID=UPI003FD3A5F8